MKDSVHTLFVKLRPCCRAKFCGDKKMQIWWLRVKTETGLVLRDGRLRAISRAQEEDEWTDSSSWREARKVSPSFVHSFHPPASSLPPLSSLFRFLTFFHPSVYAGLQNADLIRDNLTPSTRSCFDELNPSRLGVSTALHLLFPKLRHRRIFRPQGRI